MLLPIYLQISRNALASGFLRRLQHPWASALRLMIYAPESKCHWGRLPGFAFEKRTAAIVGPIPGNLPIPLPVASRHPPQVAA